MKTQSRWRKQSLDIMKEKTNIEMACTPKAMLRQESLMSHQMVASLNSLRLQEKFCDIQITTPDHTFNLHKLILVASSDYFRDILNGNPEQQQIVLKNIKTDVFRILIDYMYTGVIEVDPVLLPEIYEGACTLQLSDIASWCQQVISSHLSVQTCVHYLNFAEKYSESDLLSQCTEYLKSNFSNISKLDNFYRLSSKALAEVVACDDLKCKSEVEVFTAYRRWLDHNPEYLKNHKEENDAILENIRFGLIPLKVNKKIIDDDIVMADSEKSKYVLNAIEFQEAKHKRPLFAGKFCRPRSNNHMVVLGAPSESHSRHSELMMGLDKIDLIDTKNETVSQMAMPLFLSNRQSVAMVEFNNFLFLFGGFTLEPSGELEVTNQSHRYDPLCDKWTELSPMLTGRFGASSFVLGESIYIVGGCDKDGNVLETGERYDIANDSWEPCANLPEGQGHFDAACCVLNGYAFLSGGSRSTQNNQQKSDDIWKFHESDKTWERIGSMLEPRSGHAMCTDGKRLYIIGGSGQSVPLASAEVFDIESESVSKLSSMPRPKGYISAICSGNKIYVCGGTIQMASRRYQIKIDLDKDSDSDDERAASLSKYSRRSSKQGTDDVITYDISNDEWKNSPHKLSHPISKCTSAVLVLPQRR